jgi:hypothetical protein
MFCPSNARLQGVYIASDLRSYRGPVSSSRIANGFDFPIYLLGRLRGSSACLLFTCLDFSMRFFLCGGHCIFGTLGANGQIGELLGESLRHVFSPTLSA